MMERFARGATSLRRLVLRVLVAWEYPRGTFWRSDSVLGRSVLRFETRGGLPCLREYVQGSMTLLAGSALAELRPVKG